MSREEIEKFLTAEGHAKVEQFMADAADEDDEVDMDEVVRRNLADHAAVLHGPTDTNTGEAAGRAQHPDDAAVAEVRAWLGGLDDEAQVQFKVCKLRGVLNVLDGWERAARGAADQRNAAELRLETAKVDMRMLRDEGKRLRADLRTTNIRARTAEIAWSRQQNIIEAERRRAETAERELAEMRAKHQPGPNLHAWRRPDGYRVHGDEELIRGSVKRYGGTFETAETCRYQGEWKPADK